MAEEQKDEDVPAAPEVGEMKSGDYMIHVYVISGKNFKSKDNDTICPLITVETCGEKKYSASKDGIACGSTAMVHWKEHMFFEPRKIHSSKISQETIAIKVMNKGIFRDELIGMYEFDMTTIYFKQKHAMQHQMIALFNPEGDDFSEITGNLLISIAVQGPGDEQVQLNDQTGPDSGGQVVLMPAQIKKEFKQLKIRFITAEKLPHMDMFGSIDAYIKGKFQGKEYRTKAVTAKNDACAIEQEIWLPIQWPLPSDRLMLQLLDQDKTYDEAVGSMFFSLKRMIAGGSIPGGKYFWHNMYGAPSGYSGTVCGMMTENPELGSAWKGRILMHIEAEEAKNPERREQILDPEIKQNAISFGIFQEKEWEVIAEVGMGICLPKNSSYYKVMIQIADFNLTTAWPKEYKNNYNRWSERFQKTSMMTPTPTFGQLGQVFVYLMDGSNPICYWKGSVEDFKDPNPKFRWLNMHNDKAVGKVSEDYDAGLIQLKLSIHPKHSEGPIDFKQYDAWKKPPPRRLNSKKIRCFIFQCRDIPSADAEGSSDAYITVWNPEGEEFKTRIIEDSLNPIYFETIEMLYDFSDLDSAPPVVFNIWDHDSALIGSNYDYLGRAAIYLADANTNLQYGEDESECNKVPKPKWHDIRIGFDESSPPCGQLLVSFVIAESDFEFQTPAQYVKLSQHVPTKEYDLDINVLGLRQLESFGLMPIKKPYIKFMIKSMLPPEKAQAITNVQTDPNAPGSNPNINTTLTFNVGLPIEELYCPSLACEVYDYVFMGWSQPLIGTFSLPIGQLKSKRESQRNESLLIIDQIVEFLKGQIVKDEETLKRESQASLQRQGSQISDAAKKRMSIKLKSGGQVARAKLSRGVMKVAALNKVSEEVKQPKHGYNELKDEPSDGKSIESADEENQNQLLFEKRDSCDETLFKGLSENDPLMVQRRLLQDAQKKLDEYLNKQKAKNRKMTKQEEAMKASLQKGLLQQRIKFKEEQKNAQAAQRELTKLELKQSGAGGHQNIILPQYELNEKLKVYEEVKIPPKDLYMAVGYNDLEKVKVFMEGNDKEKRIEAATAQTNRTNRSSVGLPRGSTVRNQKALKDAEFKKKEEARQMEVTNLHYRKFYEDELENDRALFPDPDEPFIRVPIKRGQSRGLQKSWLSILSADDTDESGQVTNEKVVGYFKGRIKVQNHKEELEWRQSVDQRLKEIFDMIRQIHQKMFKTDLEYNSLEDINSKEKLEQFGLKMSQMTIDDPRLIEFFKDASYDEVIKKQLLTKTACLIELYILEGYDFASRDIGSFSDPYMYIVCGNREYSERDNYLLDEPNPKIYKRFEFTAEFPGAPMLEIEAYDYDDLFGDDLIGKTSVDLDDRFFNGDWQAIEEKPIEYRQIYHDSTSLSQGVIMCWIEIEPSNKQDKKQKQWDIAPEPVKDYQIRLSVMDTENVPCEDFEGVSDVFIRCYIDDTDKKDTDTHFRCSSGAASFNWRIFFDVQSPRKNPLMLVLQAWDFDLFKSNDYICEWTLDLEEVFRNVRLTQKKVILNQTYYDAFLKKRMPVDFKIEFGSEDSFILTTYKDDKEIKIRLDLRIMPKEVADKSKVGEARDDPNREPFLPPPAGRIKFSLNPFTMLSQLVGPDFLRKIYSILCCFICCVLCIMCAPMIFSNIMSTLVMKTIGLG